MEGFSMRRHRLVIGILLGVLVLALPTAALANKRIYSADLLTSEGAQRGSALLGTNQDGTMRYQVVARSLSSPVTAAHIHSAEDGSILVTLCGSGPGIPACTPAPGDPNSVMIVGNVTPAMMSAPGGTVNALLVAEMTYVNVHTTVNPGGEVSGTLFAH
jgi:hypothetical protein